MTQVTLVFQFTRKGIPGQPKGFKGLRPSRLFRPPFPKPKLQVVVQTHCLFRYCTQLPASRYALFVIGAQCSNFRSRRRIGVKLVSQPFLGEATSQFKTNYPLTKGEYLGIVGQHQAFH